MLYYLIFWLTPNAVTNMTCLTQTRCCRWTVTSLPRAGLAAPDSTVQLRKVKLTRWRDSWRKVRTWQHGTLTATRLSTGGAWGARLKWWSYYWSGVATSTQGVYNDNSTALILASYNGHTDTVRVLVEKGADLNVKNNDGNTALILASARGHTDIVRMLVQKGADPTVRNNDGQTAADVADNQEIKQILQRGKHWIWLIRIVTHIDKITCCYLEWINSMLILNLKSRPQIRNVSPLNYFSSVFSFGDVASWTFLWRHWAKR